VPLYDFKCDRCQQIKEVYLKTSEKPAPECCGESMTRQYCAGDVVVKFGPALWMNRMDDIHKAQEQRGEKLRFVHPSEIGAN